MDLSTLASEWDSEQSLRKRLREGSSVLHPDSGKGEDIGTSIKNQELLIPLLTRMSVAPKRALPGIDPLREGISALLTLNKRPPKPEDWDDIMATAWRLRFLLGFIKMKVRRKEVSKVARLMFVIARKNTNMSE